jgi:hypothetical protein
VLAVARYHGYTGKHTSQTEENMNRISRLIEDQPCTCFAAEFGLSGPAHRPWCAKVDADLLPGYAASRDGLADAADQRKADAR